MTSPPDISQLIALLPQIAKIFKETDLTATDLVHPIVKPVPGEPAEPKVILEGSQSGIKLSFGTNRALRLHIPI